MNKRMRKLFDQVRTYKQQANLLPADDERALSKLPEWHAVTTWKEAAAVTQAFFDSQPTNLQALLWFDMVVRANHVIGKYAATTVFFDKLREYSPLINHVSNWKPEAR